VIDTEFGSENHGSISRNCDQEGAKTTWIPRKWNVKKMDNIFGTIDEQK
jgi:hypothetical protein